MKRFLLKWLVAFAVVLPAASAFAQAQPAPSEYTPTVGQPGKDVVWVPTSRAMVNKMLDMASLSASDYLIDLGSGDGRTVITAAKRGARALGIEYNPSMFELSKQNAAKDGVADRASFINGDLFQTDLSRATVITMFLLPEINLKLRPKVLDLKPGTRIVSNTFTMGDWKADDTATVGEQDGCTYYCTALMWVVPAKVAGVWQSPQGELTLRQTFQVVEGTLKHGDELMAVTNTRLRGEYLSFNVGTTEYDGRVSGNRIEGSTRTAGATTTWKASRRRQ